ncbi:MAG TPA: KH domain-containing protein [Candidatus Rifleibacterium sp.]|nr:KH domain-containing protein [Candidatus Rifleibacterium sp.]HPT45508.1 KH domain-containing protein [Candidatus Rifleibacterium sp.]
MTQTAQNLLDRLVKALVEHPEEVVITPIEGDGTVVFEVQVNPEDAGKIIGKKGRTINALRTIIRSSANTGTKKVIMELV